MTYRATDDDLPDVFWSGKPQVSKYPPDEELRSVIAAQLHYPEIKLTRKQQRDLDRDRRESSHNPLGGDRKKFVRLPKKQQMFDCLRDLEATFPAMDTRERQFCEQMLAKFRKYTPVLAKWVTEKQYRWCNFIAGKYLKLPRRT